MISLHNQKVKYEKLTFINKAVNFGIMSQACDRTLWRKFVDQFRWAKEGKDIDSQNRSWRCEYWGKVMRGACMIQKLTADDTLYNIIDETVRDMLTTQDDLGRFSTYSVEKEWSGWDLWGRKYVLLGFIYFLDICRDNALREEIIAALTRHVDYIIAHIGDGEGKTPIYKATTHWLGINSSSILEPVVLLYEITKEQRHLDFAKYIIDCGMADGFNLPEALLKGDTYPYQFPVVKAYEMMSCIEGMLEYYRITGEEKYLTMAVNFTKLVRESDITIIGCAGCTHELFDHSAVRQTYTKYEGIMQETCVTVTWMKLNSKLLILTGDPVYADDMEKSYYNAYLGACNFDLNSKNQSLPYDSYSPLMWKNRGVGCGGKKPLNDETGEYYGCCAAIATLGAAMFAYGALTVDDKAIYLNFYDNMIADVTYKGRKATVSVDGNYPMGDLVKIKAECPEGPLSLCVRIPDWCESATLIVNSVRTKVGPGYYRFDRHYGVKPLEFMIWFNMPVVCHKPIGCEEDPASYNFFALTRGPLVLAADERIVGEEPVCEPVINAKGKVPYKRTSVGVRHNLAVEVPTADGKTLTLIDYASAGADWDNETKIAAWIRTK